MVQGDQGNWPERLNHIRLKGAEYTVASVDEFLERATTELEPFHIGADIEAKVVAIGCKIIGTRYFAELYSDDETVSPDERMKSAFTGSVAYGRDDLAEEAYGFLALTTGSDIRTVNDDLIGRLNEAIRNERRAGDYKRL